MKKILNYFAVLTLVLLTFTSITNNLNNNFMGNSPFKALNKNLNYKPIPSNNKLNFNVTDYEITNSNTELETCLVSNSGNTKNSSIIATKVKNLLFPNDVALKININTNAIDLTKSYYIKGDIDLSNNNFIPTGKKIKNLTKTFTISSNGIYNLHLKNIYGNNFYDSYLELGQDNWKLSSIINEFELWYLAKKLNVLPVNSDFMNKEEKLKFLIWLNNYQFDANRVFEQNVALYNKGYIINVEDFPLGYINFLDWIEYSENSNENINIEKLKTSIIIIAVKNLQFDIFQSEYNINMHGYNIQQVLNNNALPQSKTEINNYRNNQSFHQWLQNQVNIKFYFYQLTIKITGGSLILLLLIITFIILFFVRCRRIYQPSTLKELNCTKEQIRYFKKNKIIINIYKFIKLNSKINKYYFFKKYNNIFSLVQELFKNNLYTIEYNKYDNIFYHKNNKNSLLGKQFINIFLKCKDINEYNNKIRINYPNCFSNKLHKLLLYEVLNFYLNKVKNSHILSEEVNFNINIKLQLAKIRLFLKNQEWNYYFFDLQNLMHKNLINFLNWKDKGLNFSAYGKVLKRKLFWILQSEANVELFLNTVQTVNFYRNLLSKVSPIKQNKLIEWNLLSDKSKEELAWKIYFSLIEFIKLTNNYS